VHSTADLFSCCGCWMTEHRRGVAGGGWDDEEDDHDAAVNTPSVNHSVSSNSTGMERDRWRTSEMLLLGLCN